MSAGPYDHLFPDLLAHSVDVPAEARLQLTLDLDLDVDVNSNLQIVWVLDQGTLYENVVFVDHDEEVSEEDDFVPEIPPFLRHLLNPNLREERQDHHHGDTVSDDEGEAGVEEDDFVPETPPCLRHLLNPNLREERQDHHHGDTVSDDEGEAGVEEEDEEFLEVTLTMSVIDAPGSDQEEVGEDDHEEEDVDVEVEESSNGELLEASREAPMCDNSLGGTSTCQVSSELDPAPSTSGTRKRTREVGAEEEPPAKRISHHEEEEVDVEALSEEPEIISISSSDEILEISSGLSHDEEEEVDVEALSDEPEIISISSSDEILEISSGLSGYDTMSSEDEEFDEDEDDLPPQLRFVQRIPPDFRLPWYHPQEEEPLE